jgi:hypothetical protein
MLDLLVAARKISAIKIGVSIHRACLLCGLPALLVHFCSVDVDSK